MWRLHFLPDFLVWGHPPAVKTLSLVFRVGLSMLGFCDLRLWVGVESLCTTYLCWLGGVLQLLLVADGDQQSPSCMCTVSLPQGQAGTHKESIHFRLLYNFHTSDSGNTEEDGMEKSLRARGSGGLIPLRLCLLGMLKAMPMNPHQHGCQTWDEHM